LNGTRLKYCLLILGAMPASGCGAAAVAPPDPAAAAVERYEVKFGLQPARVLSPAGASIDSVDIPALRTVFNIDQAGPERFVVRFLDSCDQRLYGMGWAVRLREAAGATQLTYKKRFPLSNEAETAGGLKDVATARLLADRPHFDPKVEVDWGPSRATLSVTLETELPGNPPADPRSAAVQHAPPAMKGDAHALDALRSAVVHGPVQARRWEGRWPGENDKLQVEVWQIGSALAVETSFKSKDQRNAAARREVLRKLLHKKGWLSSEESFRTDAVLKAHKPASCP